MAIPGMQSYSYLVCFSVNPAQVSFAGRNSSDYKKVDGFNAFNQYFDMLAPNTYAQAIPDVWHGYYRITLAQFDSTATPEQLRQRFESFRPTFNVAQMKELVFKTRKIGAAPYCFRLGKDFADEPIALYITPPPELQLDSVLDEIKKQIGRCSWTQIRKSLLHMNIQLYSQTAKGNETLKKIKQDGISEKVREHPIEFHRTTLQVIPSRETCKMVYQNEPDTPWWTGVTELAGKCTGCQDPVEENKWKGVCSPCNKCERIKPIWSVRDIPTADILTDEVRQMSL